MNSLDETILNHFDAIKNRDIDLLLETVDKGKISLILPNGNYTRTTTDYKKVNVESFSDKD